MKDIIEYLNEHFKRGRPILVTGAGFGRNAVNLADEPLPFGQELSKKIWEMVYPGEPYDQSTKLQDIFEYAKGPRRNELTKLLKDQLTINPNKGDLSLYDKVFSLPWFRHYTLNADNLDKAVQIKYALKRPLAAIDGMPEINEGTDKIGHIGSKLFSVHLHGLVENTPDHVTFGTFQYASREKYADSWYSTFATELMTHPVVFVGTNLDEPSLWAHIEQRRTKGGRKVREHRRRSFLVTPHLSKARADLLATFNVEWIQMDTQTFYDTVLSGCESSIPQGHTALSQTSRDSQESIENDKKLFTLEEILTDALKDKIDSTARDFLMGAEPTWNDIRSGAAARRSCEEVLLTKANTLIGDKKNSVLVVTGTAGSGKSTLLRSLALVLHEQGEHIGWIDQYHRPPQKLIKEALESETGPNTIFIDDAEIYGNSLEPTIRELLSSSGKVNLVIALRSNLIERFLGNISKDEQIVEFDVPHLEDSDIEGILDSLNQFNRLGELKGKIREQQREILRTKSGRQLLVAMIEATSGRDFDEKCVTEFDQLTRPEQIFYSIATVATIKGIAIGQEDILLAADQQSNQDLELLNNLIARGLLIKNNGIIKLRHKVIAEKVFNHIVAQKVAAEPIAGLLFALCAKLDNSLARTSRPWRNVAILLNHDFLYRSCDLNGAEGVYGDLEMILRDNHHYWLQRGSLQVEQGNLKLAEQFLNQAHGLQPNDEIVLVERCYLRLKLAHTFPNGTSSVEMARESIKDLIDLVDRRGNKDPYPIHILCKQGLAWARRGPISDDERLQLISMLTEKVKQALKFHARRFEIQELHTDVEKAYLSLAVTR